MMRLFCAVWLLSWASVGFTAEPLAKSEAVEENGVLWYDALQVGVEGRMWSDVEAPYDRFPARAKATLREDVWNLSRNSAGMCVHFQTNAPELHVRWTVTSSKLGKPHMPSTGVSGVDLYARDDAGVWRWVACGIPTAETTTAQLTRDFPASTSSDGRDFRLYLPLYNGTKKLEIGIPKESDLRPAQAYDDKHRLPMVFYGTSIMHGASASRPGMAYPSILGRRLDRPVVNLGFSGNGRLEMEVATLMAEIDASVYVLDCLPNLQHEQVRERTEPVVQFLKQKHSNVPILLVEDRTYSDAIFRKEKRKRNDDSRREFRAAFERLQGAGVTGLYYLEGEHLLGDDNEGTVDSSHPTDLGFWRQADAMTPVLREIVGP